jgi:hypothetical protein
VAEPEPPQTAIPVWMKNAGGARSEPKTKTLAADMAVQEKRGAAAAPLPVGTWSKGNEQGAGLDGLVPKFPKSSSTTDCNPASDPPPRRRLSSERRLRWAELLKRVFELDALRCPVCDGKMRVLAAITHPEVARPHPEVPIPAAPGTTARSGDVVGRATPRTRDGCPGCQLADRPGIPL